MKVVISNYLRTIYKKGRWIDVKAKNSCQIIEFVKKEVNRPVNRLTLFF